MARAVTGDGYSFGNVSKDDQFPGFDDVLHAARRSDRWRIIFARYLWSGVQLTLEEFAWQLHAQNFACRLCTEPFVFGHGRKPTYVALPSTALDAGRGLLCIDCRSHLIPYLQTAGLRRLWEATDALGAIPGELTGIVEDTAPGSAQP